MGEEEEEEEGGGGGGGGGREGEGEPDDLRGEDDA